MAHTVAVLALDDVIAFDLAIPEQVFASALGTSGDPLYEVRVCGQRRTVTATNGPTPQFMMSVPWGCEAALEADTIVVPGVSTFDRLPDRRVVAVLQAAFASGIRLASICTGAFVLAAAGVLDGKAATTHWEQAARLAAAYPSVDVDPGVLFVDNGGKVLTSAGLCAGIDLCLYLVGRDFGAAVAADTARRMVMPMVRSGGQAQFIAHRAPAADDVGLRPTLEWMERNLAQPLTLQDIAGHARTSMRSLNRRFRTEVGTTPLQWLLDVRVQRAKELLETTDLSVERIAAEVGLGSGVNLRQHFVRRVGVPPQRYRAAFKANDASGAPATSDVRATVDASVNPRRSSG